MAMWGKCSIFAGEKIIHNKSMKKYPIGIQTFADIRNEGYIYVDKTDLVFKLANEGRYYFLSRPRRFGKSLLISTMGAYFSGKKELFKGLSIEKLEKDWTQCPVFLLDLNGGLFTSVENFRNELNQTLTKWEEQYGKGEGEILPGDRFRGLIKRAFDMSGRKKVAILVDEYDKPLLQNIGDTTLQDDLRKEMKAFFSQIKSQDQYIRFAFFTGVTKFSKVSIFSDLNNLTDISFDKRYDRICGISQKELTDVFEQSIKEMAEANNVDYGTMVGKLQARYDGYHFSEGMTDMFNPFSVLNALSSQKLRDYWFSTGTPTFLMQLLRNNSIAIDQLGSLEMDESAISDVDVMMHDPVPVLYQSGYLTIKSYDSDSMLYTLDFPNQEVSGGFMTHLLPFYSNIQVTRVSGTIEQLRKAIVAADINRFMLIMKSFFAGYDYSVIGKESLEVYYQNVIFAICKLIGLRVKAEYHTSSGRIDMLIETGNSVFIFEFKLNLGVEDALAQIEAKDYSAQFAADSRKVYKIGVDFDSSIRGIKDWKVA